MGERQEEAPKHVQPPLPKVSGRQTFIQKILFKPPQSHLFWELQQKLFHIICCPPQNRSRTFIVNPKLLELLRIQSLRSQKAASGGKRRPVSRLWWGTGVWGSAAADRRRCGYHSNRRGTSFGSKAAEKTHNLHHTHKNKHLEWGGRADELATKQKEEHTVSHMHARARRPWSTSALYLRVKRSRHARVLFVC